ncbi:uncharacterized protein LOC106708042 [Papilio machaon]|uniref:uncharacterized protein LOC106708042 n=1 Tax=Papilio machaon TaxID=76193 RepID=UPI001E665100|nr:uncharacterized protein LOC106708042 [Papilio machaon]
MKSYTTPDSYSATYYMAGQDQNPGSSKAGTDGHGQPPMQPMSAVPQYMQNNPYSTPYFMYDQGSPSYPTGMPQSPNVMTQPPYGSPRMPMTQNTNVGYGESNYGNNQPMTVTSDQPDFIPCGNDKPRNDYHKIDNGSRYFEEKNDQKYRDRSERPSTSRGDRETYEPRSRSVERRHGDWSPDRFRRSDNRKSDSNPKQSGDSYNQSYNRNYKSEPEGSGFRRSSDGRCNASNTGKIGDDYNRRFEKDQDGNYNRSSDRAPVNITENTRFKWTKPQNDNMGGYNDSKPSTSKGGNYSSNDFNPHTKFDDIQDSIFPGFQPAIYLSKAEYKKIKKARDLKRSAIERKNETWRAQATSKIVKTALEESGLMIQAKKPGFVQFMKSIVRTRINKMLGPRVGVPMENILEEYNKKYPPHVRKNFVLESKAKFNKITDFPSGAAPIRRPLMNQAGPEKRPATEQPQAAPAPKKKPPVEIPRPPPYRPPTPGPLPKYPNADKQAYKKLKTLAKEEHEKEIYTLEPKLKEALENEINVLRDLFIKGCRNNKGGEDEKICQRIEKTTDEVMKVIKLDVTKRLLNVTCNLPLRMFANDRFNVKEIGPLLKPYGIISCRKSPRSKLCVVVCQDYPSYDYLCTKREIDLGEGLIMSFKPLHLAGPTKRPKKKNGKKLGNNEHTSGDEDEEFGDEMAGEDDEGAGDDIKENKDVQEIDIKNEQKINKDIIEEKDIEIVDCNKDDECIEVKLKDKPTDEKVLEIDTNEHIENSETETLVKDINELKNSIFNDDKVEVVQSAETIDVSNIGQDDLEDY